MSRQSSMMCASTNFDPSPKSASASTSCRCLSIATNRHALAASSSPRPESCGPCAWLPLLILLPLTLLQDFLQPLHDLERVWAWYILQCSTTHIAVHSHADFCKIDGSDHLTKWKCFGHHVHEIRRCLHTSMQHIHTRTHTHTSIFPHCGTTTCPINSSMVITGVNASGLTVYSHLTETQHERMLHEATCLALHAATDNHQLIFSQL